MRTMRKHPALAGLAGGILVGAALGRTLDVGAALVVGAWLGACLHRAAGGRLGLHRRPVEGTRAETRAEASARRAEELHGLRAARERARLRDQLIRLRAGRSSWLRSRREQQRREAAAYARGVEETLASWASGPHK